VSYPVLFVLLVVAILFGRNYGPEVEAWLVALFSG
jgi:hypothetical protein